MRVTFPLIPAAYTPTVSVQVSGFEDLRLLTHCDRLLCDSCSSGQCFAFGFLQIPPRDGHLCRSANRSPCRADSGLAPPSHPATTTCTGTAPVTAGRTCASPTVVDRGLFQYRWFAGRTWPAADHSGADGLRGAHARPLRHQPAGRPGTGKMQVKVRKAGTRK